MHKKTINVTRTYLPPLSSYTRYLRQIWQSTWVTNNGPLVQELELRLSEFLAVKHVLFTSNGTIALQLAIKILGLRGEIITTPFSYVATTSSILWESCTPIFVDIDPKTCCINADLIESKINSKTEAILATHVYGIPCDVEKIQKIAKKYKLKVIYDAAHAFGTVYKNKHLTAYGDVATLSFHATKLFHTIEGGAIVTNNDELAKKIKLYRSFGHIKDEYFTIGINGKNSEFHAAMGLCLVDKVPSFIKERRSLHRKYDLLLKGLDLVKPEIPKATRYNYSYYPIFFQNEEVLIKNKKKLEKGGIICRRYFYPSLNMLPYLKSNYECPISEEYSKKVLCLPLYQGLSKNDMLKISQILKTN